MLFSKLGLIGALVGNVIAAPSPQNHVLHERRDVAVSQWAKRERLSRDVLLPMRIGLQQSNLEYGDEMIMEVSHPESPKHGQWYSEEELTEFFAPSKDSVALVRAWLESAGVAKERISQSVNKQWLQFDAKVGEVEELLKTRYHLYEHVDSGKTNIACDEYHVPGHVTEHIDYITPGIKLSKNSGLPAPSRTIKKRGNGWGKGNDKHHHRKPPTMPMPTSVPDIIKQELAMCGTYITPPCIKAMYNITTGTKAAPGNELGIFEDLGDVYSQEDLNLFFQNLAPYIPQGTHPTLDAIDGAVAPTDVADAGAESDLDFQISYPIIWPQNSILFQTDDPYYESNYTYAGFLNNFFDGIDGSYCTYSAYGETGNSVLDPPYPDPNPGGYKGQLQCGKYKPTNVISISYGGGEYDLPVSYQRRQCSEIMKLGLRGVTVVVASGDYGVASFPDDPSANGCLGADSTIFNPDFPATCPYLTSVGSTTLPPNASVYADAEISTTRFPSGGGFSNIYVRESEAPWQVSAVDAYFAQNLVDYPYYSTSNNHSVGVNGGLYNRIGRAYPDVAAIGDFVVIYYEGAAIRIGGTSASSPTFAAILTRINEERIARGKSTVGFINPTLYANPQAFHDITNGSNPGCGTDGFIAGKGWDPVSGLGTPDYPKLLDVFLSI